LQTDVPHRECQRTALGRLAAAIDARTPQRTGSPTNSETVRREAPDRSDVASRLLFALPALTTTPAAKHGSAVAGTPRLSHVGLGRQGRLVRRAVHRARMGGGLRQHGSHGNGGSRSSITLARILTRRRRAGTGGALPAAAGPG
jgi:hypothetical protein